MKPFLDSSIVPLDRLTYECSKLAWRGPFFRRRGLADEVDWMHGMVAALKVTAAGLCLAGWDLGGAVKRQGFACSHVPLCQTAKVHAHLCLYVEVPTDSEDNSERRRAKFGLPGE